MLGSWELLVSTYVLTSARALAGTSWKGREGSVIPHQILWNTACSWFPLSSSTGKVNVKES